MLDGSEYASLIEAFDKAEHELDLLSQQMPMAGKTQKFAIGNEKSLLATYIVKYIKEGNKPALAETLGWADPAFQSQRQALLDLWEEADRTIQRYKQAEKKWETERSKLSLAKAQFPAAYSATRNFPG